jgi:Tfp pilus assembly protein PilF
MITHSHKKTFLKLPYEPWICLFLILITLVVYFQVGTFDFNSYDTADYVYENRYVKAGLTTRSINWAFSAVHASNWHPLTWLSHMLDVQIFGLDSGRHHLINVIFHIANTLLLFGVLRLMTGNLWPSGLVAILFALHPLHVQSVAWVAERKDVLSTFFGLLAIWAYMGYGQRPTIGRYMPVFLFFILGLLAKPMIVTLPFVLLLLDFWPLERFQFEFTRPKGSTPSETISKGSLVVEKIPLFIAAAASCVVTVYAQQAGGAVSSLAEISLSDRIVNALVSYAGYIARMIWPAKLAVIYPYPGGWPAWQIWTACCLLAGLSFLVIRYCKSRPWLLVGWLWYLGTLVPVIGLVQVGAQAMADRYTYLPSIGLFIMFAWGLPDLMGRFRVKKPVLVIITAAIVIALGAVAYKQVGYWQNTVTLFEHTLEVTQNNYVAHNNLGHHWMERGKTDRAVTHFNKALQINPDFEIAHLNLGLILSRQGRLGAAIKHYFQALQINPDYTIAHNNMGNALYRLGKADKAIGYYLEAIRIDPEYAEVYNNLGAALIRVGEIEKAVVFFKEALRIDPGYIDAQKNLENTLAALRKSQ